MIKVMVLDDSETVRRQVAVLLESAGHTVVEARDGLEGMERLSAMADVQVMLVDVNMPRMGGIEMLERLRDRGDLQRVAALILTTEVDPNLIARARAAGAKGWVVKPVRAEVLIPAVERLIRD